MKTIAITPANEKIIPFLKELLSNPDWVSKINIYDDEVKTPSFMCTVEELNDSLCVIEKELAEGKINGITSNQMRKKHVG
jgi:hypothetical protein